jgi:hypothetical protein
MEKRIDSKRLNASDIKTINHAGLEFSRVKSWSRDSNLEILILNFRVLALVPINRVLNPSLRSIVLKTSPRSEIIA